MILTNEQLRTTLTGAAEIIEKDGMLTCYRFSRRVRDVVYPEGTRFHPATLQSSGVVSRFITDAKTLTFTYCVDKAATSQSFDVWADGIFYATFPCAKTTATVSVALPEGDKEVTVYYPHHLTGRIYDVTLEEATHFANAPARARKILFIGDSITHGSTSVHASMTYAHQLSRALDAEVLNQGIGGEGFNPMAVDTALPFAPDLISVAYGTNNWSHDPSHAFMAGVTVGHLAGLRDLYPDKPIAVILPTWRGDHVLTGKPVGSFEEGTRIVRAAAEQIGAYVVDGLRLVPHVPGVYADAPRSLHPSEFGFQFYAENLIPHYKKLLEA